MDSLSSVILWFLAGPLSEFLGLSDLETVFACVFRVMLHMGSCCEDTQSSLWSEHVPSGVEGVFVWSRVGSLLFPGAKSGAWQLSG